MCSITSVEAETYEVAARQIMIEPRNIMLVENSDMLPVVIVYDAVTCKKPAWWTVRTDDHDWSSLRCSCTVFRCRKLCVHAVLACHKSQRDTYLKSYGRCIKPSAMQMIQAEQKEFKKRTGRKGNKP